jgi:hypothetical protein
MQFEHRQQMFRTVRSPCREEPMLGKSQWPTAMGRDKSPVTHRSPRPPNVAVTGCGGSGTVHHAIASRPPQSGARAGSAAPHEGLGGTTPVTSCPG